MSVVQLSMVTVPLALLVVVVLVLESDLFRTRYQMHYLSWNSRRMFLDNIGWYMMLHKFLLMDRIRVCTNHIFHICLVWFIISLVGLYFVSYNGASVLFLLFFCNKFEIWWLYQSSTVYQC